MLHAWIAGCAEEIATTLSINAGMQFVDKAGTLLLEMAALSRASGNPEYEERAKAAAEKVAGKEVELLESTESAYWSILRRALKYN